MRIRLQQQDSFLSSVIKSIAALKSALDIMRINLDNQLIRQQGNMNGLIKKITRLSKFSYLVNQIQNNLLNSRLCQLGPMSYWV